MSNVYTSIDQLIGHTPLLELTHFEADEDLKARVLVKLEYFNPAGSVKDRVAKNMIDEAEKAGKLVRGGDYTIIEPTSGNTGVGIDGRVNIAHGEPPKCSNDWIPCGFTVCVAAKPTNLIGCSFCCWQA